MNVLESRLAQLARSGVLLVACDFDGVLAPIAPDPSAAEPLPGAIGLLRRLAMVPQTFSAVVSGRALADLRSLTDGESDGVELVGSHGGELAFAPALLSPGGAALLREVTIEVEALVAACPGSLLERKPFGVAVHYRKAEPAAARALVDRVGAGPATRAGVRLREGKMVVELEVVHTSKAVAVQRLAYRVGATAVVFLGDDATDEDVFHVLTPADLGIKVGVGDTAATQRVDGPEQAVAALQRLGDWRRAWWEEVQPTPINRHSILSDQRTLAIVDDAAQLVWLCLPRVDSPAVFSSLLGGPKAGRWSIRPIDTAGSAACGAPRVQHYKPGSMILETRWSCAGGSEVRVTDYMDCTGGRAYQRAGRSDLVRVIDQGSSGSGGGSDGARVRIEFAPRLDFGRMATQLKPRSGGLEVVGALDPMVLVSPGVEWTIIDEAPHQTAIAEVDLSARAEPVILELRGGVGSTQPGLVPEVSRREQTDRFWSRWADSLALPTLHRELVRRSALALKALSHGPTGAILAAATTSLPEWPGGSRNWDYRFCWPRDAALAAAALVRLGNTGHALKLLDWMLGVVDRIGSPERLRPIYTVNGSDLGAEGEVGELSGYRASKPVRLGNAAAQQVQLDVFGPIVDLVWLLAQRGAPLSPEHWRLVEAMATAVDRRWHEADHGIWEIRSSRRHHVHSKVMCYVAADRAAKLAPILLGRERDDYSALRDRIRDDVLRHGWSERLGAFAAAYDHDALDAGTLMIGLSGLVPMSDDRYLRTLDAVEKGLLRGSTVLRYDYDDALPGREGGFYICTSWLIEALAATGRVDRARELLDQMTAQAGPTGLLPEQYEPREGVGIGNYPQAYSHLGLINATVAVEAAMLK